MPNFCWCLTSENYYRFAPALLATTALCLAVLSTGYCEFVVLPWNDMDGNLGQTTLGLWNYKSYEEFQNGWSGETEIQGSCISFAYNYGPLPIDAKWRTAQAFSAIAVIVGAITSFWIWFAPCFNCIGTKYRCLGLLCLSTSLYQGLTLVYLAADVCKPFSLTNGAGEPVNTNGCIRMWGANASIAATVMWFLAGAATLTIPAPVMPSGHDEMNNQQVTYEQSTMPDGTKVTSENVTVVQEEVVPPLDA
jgi:peptidoglycan/LPS O-acetylase OafA/YrhL